MAKPKPDARKTLKAYTRRPRFHGLVGSRVMVAAYEAISTAILSSDLIEDTEYVMS